MTLTVIANGHIELRISDPTGRVQTAALEEFCSAVESGKTIRVKASGGVLSVVLGEE